MLQAIRSKVASWVAKTLFVMLILSFAVWGIGDIFTQRTTLNPVATVGDTKVTPMQLDRAFRDLVAQYRQAFGPAFDVEQARQFGLVDQALDGLIRDALFDEAAKRLGLRVGDELVRTEITEIPAFRDASGRFSAAQFRFVLQQNQLTEQDVIGIVRRNLAQQALTGGLAAGAVAPGVLAEDLYRHRAERRVAEVIEITAARFADVPVPDEPTIVAPACTHTCANWAYFLAASSASASQPRWSVRGPALA
jgi:peptidyl-prolyl cis-trans isomerase D